LGSFFGIKWIKLGRKPGASTVKGALAVTGTEIE